MDLLQPPTRTATAAGTLLAAAHGPGTLARVIGHAAHPEAACSGWRLLDPCGAEVVDHDQDGDNGGRRGYLSGRPFAVEVVDECTTLSNRDYATYTARARDLLAQVESAAVARELWTGELATAAAGGDPESQWADNVALASPDTDDLTPAGGPVPLVRGLALLEDALGDLVAGGQKAVHLTRGTATLLADPAGLYRSGDVLLTPLDTRVIADAGYPGTGPDGEAPADGEAWLYGTARPAVYLSDAETLPGQLDQALDRATNTVRVTGQRYALTTLPCGVIAVRVTLD